MKKLFSIACISFLLQSHAFAAELTSKVIGFSIIPACIDAPMIEMLNAVGRQYGATYTSYPALAENGCPTTSDVTLKTYEAANGKLDADVIFRGGYTIAIHWRVE